MGDDPQSARTVTALHRGAAGAPQATFVARASEMNKFDALLDRRHGGVVLYGAAGSGKTRLAEALVERATKAGHPTRFLRGRASIADLPLGPFAPLLPSAVERVDGVSLLVLARDAIAALGDGRPLVLGVDDVHLLDPSSAMLLHQLVVCRTVVLVATVREGEWIPEGVTELWRSGEVERWHIDDLGPEAVIEMAESILGQAIAPQVGDELVRLSGGNPLFVATLVHAVRESGVSVERAVDLGDAAAASTLVDFVTARLHGLDPTARDALAVVALGEPIGLLPLERMTDERSLVQLERGGWLVIADSDRRTEVRLAHPLFGEVLRRSLSRLLARSVYRELTHGVLSHGARRRDDLLRIAAWSVDGGAPLPPDRLASAAAEAWARGDFSLAVRLAEAAWDVEDRFDAGLLLLFLHRSSRFLADRVGFLARLRAVTTTPAQAAMVATTRSFEAFWRDGDLPGSLAILDDAIGALDGPAVSGVSSVSAVSAVSAVPAVSDARHELDAQRAAVLATCGRTDEAWAAVERARSSTSPRVLASVSYAERILEASFGEPRRVLDSFERSIEAAERVGNQLGMQSIRVIQASVCRAMVHDGQLHRAEETIRESVGDPLLANRSAGSLENLLGWVLAWRGRPREGYRWSQRAAGLQAREGFRTLENWSQGVMALCAAVAGDVPRAEAALARHEALNPTPTVTGRGIAWHARALTAAVRGDVRAAVAVAERGVAEMTSLGLVFDQAVLLHVQAQLGAAPAVADRLTELGDRVGGLPRWFAAHARALRDRDADRLALLADEVAAIGADGLAAAISADAGRAFDARGDVRAVARTSRRTRELLDQLDTAEPFVERPHLEPLSHREREVAELAAAGMPTREIAERLFLSTHTVDNHLSNVFDKLGVRSRTELTGALAG